MLVNDSRALLSYRQAALWLTGDGLRALSGLAQPELNAPYAQWLARLCAFLHENHSATAALLSSRDLPPALAEQWGEWLPPLVYWQPLGDVGGVLFAMDSPWDESAVALCAEWAETWTHAWRSRRQSGHAPISRLRTLWSEQGAQTWYRRPRLWLLVIVLLVALFPVRLSVLAPAELVAAHPDVVRAPLDGVIGQFLVEPNQAVTAGQPLFEFDPAPLQAQLQVAAQTLATAEAEYRQNASLAVSDDRSKAQLSTLVGRIAEKRAEVDYLQGQLQRTRVTAARAGVVVLDDVSEWIGKPVQVGERILRIANPADVEVEAWLPMADALQFAEHAPVQVYLSAAPLNSLNAQLRYLGFEAQPRPDGTYAYRLRAVLEGASDARLGQKGTARIYGQRVPLIYWVIRRPLAVIRQYLGF